MAQIVNVSAANLDRLVKYLYHTSDLHHNAVVVNGKAKVLRTGGFYQVENETTHALPDFGLWRRELHMILLYLANQSGNVAVEVSNQYLKIGSHNQLKLPLAVVVEADTDEIILKPLMTAPWRAKIDSYALQAQHKLMEFICKESKHTPLTVRVAGEKKKIIFSVPSYSFTLDLNTAGKLPDKWQNNFLLESFVQAIAPNWFSHTQMCDILLTEKTKEHGPYMMLKYANGVSTVLASVGV